MLGGINSMANELTWNEMVTLYPNMWVVIKNATTDGPDIVRGELVTTKTDEEICEYEDAHYDEGLIFRRTTDSEWNGTVSTDFIVKTV